MENPCHIIVSSIVIQGNNFQSSLFLPLLFRETIFTHHCFFQNFSVKKYVPSFFPNLRGGHAKGGAAHLGAAEGLV